MSTARPGHRCAGGKSANATTSRFESHGRRIAPAGGVSGIELDLSAVYDALEREGVDDVRIGVCSVSSLVHHADFKTASRFVHMLTGRVIAMDDLGVFVVDTSAIDDRAVNAVESFCDGRIDVRTANAPICELRVQGLDDGPTGWTSFTPPWETLDW